MVTCAHNMPMTTTTAPRTRKPLAPEVTPDAAHIIRVFREANDGQLAEGLAWYADAHSVAVALDPQNVLRAAGVISALSVKQDWNRNVILAGRAFADGQASGTLGFCVKAADRILSGEHVDAVLKGDKTNNFAHVIADPTDPHAVVVDRHAFDIALGRVTDDETRGILSRKGVYDAFADAYREAASVLGYSPSQVQAVTWVVWRETETKFAAANRRAAGRA
jgi:hypothetical protein